MEKGSVPYDITLVIAIAIVAWILILINGYVFKRIQKQRTYIHLKFWEKLNNVAIVFICTIVGLSLMGGADSLWKSILGGTAVISAVVIFVAQDSIKDTLAGLMISIYRPFEIGNRIELENGMSGIVKDISMRHTVIHTWGSQEIVIPNSKLNTQIILNDSYHTGTRSFQTSFRIGYGSDVDKALQVIKDAVEDSPYTTPGKKSDHGNVYDDVYFMEYEASALRMSTTVYYKNTPTEIVRSDINTRVNKALRENGIEIPYQYINIIQQQSNSK